MDLASPSLDLLGVDATADGSLPTEEVTMDSIPDNLPNAATFCIQGQEAVRELMERATNLFQMLKMTHLPTETNSSQQEFQNRRGKVEEHLQAIQELMGRLHYCYQQVETATEGLPGVGEELLPLEGTWAEHMCDQRENSAELTRVEEVLKLRTQQLKEVIDLMRATIIDMNTMMAMRKTVTNPSV